MSEIPASDPGRFYSYESGEGVLSVSWDDFVAICKGLALVVTPQGPVKRVGQERTLPCSSASMTVILASSL